MVSTLFISIIVLYLLLITWLIYGFDKVEDFYLQDLSASTNFTVVIPFRNEAENLPKLLTSISELNYPSHKFEIILVNDDSTDNSVEIVNNFINQNQKLGLATALIDNNRVSNSPKKDAISTAINKAKFDWIITTDADCILPKFWLDAFDEFIQINNPNCIVAPVTYHNLNSFFKRFQVLDFMSLQGATIGGFGIGQPFLCNGANFGYRKSVFNDLNGFKGNNTIASGDDIFILEKFVEHNKEKVGYLKADSSLVKTQPCLNLKELIDQRIRWASKSSRYKSWFAKLIAVLVLMGNLVFVALLPALLLNLLTVKSVVIICVIKVSIDFLLIFKTSRFFKQEHVLGSYLLTALIYPFFNFGIAITSLFSSFTWKGRAYKK